jgi:hypothetical protein
MRPLLKKSLLDLLNNEHVAQSVEHLTFNEVVVGSIPTVLTILSPFHEPTNNFLELLRSLCGSIPTVLTTSSFHRHLSR